MYPIVLLYTEEASLASADCSSTEMQTEGTPPDFFLNDY